MTTAQAGLGNGMGDAQPAPEPGRAALPAQSDPGPGRERRVESAPHRPAATRILIVEDEAELVRALRINLRARQYEVMAAGTGREALSLAASESPDAIILDLGLPDIDGTEVIVELRRWYHAPIIVLSGRTSPGDKIGALDVGADDYVTKPFAMAELLARLRAVLRRDDGEGGPGRVRQATIGQWQVDLAAHQVRRATAGEEETLRLTPTEWGILEVLLRRPGQLVGSAQLLTAVWGPGVPAAHQLPPLPHGAAAPQAGREPGAPPPSAHRTRHGLPIPAIRRWSWDGIWPGRRPHAVFDSSCPATLTGRMGDGALRLLGRQRPGVYARG